MRAVCPGLLILVLGGLVGGCGGGGRTEDTGPQGLLIPSTYSIQVDVGQDTTLSHELRLSSPTGTRDNLPEVEITPGDPTEIGSVNVDTTDAGTGLRVTYTNGTVTISYSGARAQSGISWRTAYGQRTFNVNASTASITLTFSNHANSVSGQIQLATDDEDSLPYADLRTYSAELRGTRTS